MFVLLRLLWGVNSQILKYLANKRAILNSNASQYLRTMCPAELLGSKHIFRTALRSPGIELEWKKLKRAVCQRQKPAHAATQGEGPGPRGGSAFKTIRLRPWLIVPGGESICHTARRLRHHSIGREYLERQIVVVM